MGLRVGEPLLLLCLCGVLLAISIVADASAGYEEARLIETTDDVMDKASFDACVFRFCRHLPLDQQMACVWRDCNPTTFSREVLGQLLEQPLQRLICTYQYCSVYRDYATVYENCANEFCYRRKLKIKSSHKVTKRSHGYGHHSKTRPSRKDTRQRLNTRSCRKLCHDLVPGDYSFCASRFCGDLDEPSTSVKRAIFMTIQKCASAYCSATRGRERIYCLRKACHRGR